MKCPTQVLSTVEPVDSNHFFAKENGKKEPNDPPYSVSTSQKFTFIINN